MLTDFGFAQPLETNDETLKLGTKKFMAPELYGNQREKYGRNVDVWAVGIVIYYYISKEYPFDARTERDLKTKILN